MATAKSKATPKAKVPAKGKGTPPKATPAKGKATPPVKATAATPSATELTHGPGGSTGHHTNTATDKPAATPKQPVRKYGWRPDLPDNRDRRFALAFPPLPTPPRVDLSGSFGPAVNQGNANSCTGNAAAACPQLSRLALYFNARKIEGTVSEDSGATIRSVCKGAVGIGAMTERDWPYLVSKVGKVPPKPKLIYRAASYQRVPRSVDAFRQLLAVGKPILFGMTVYESFESAAVANSGRVSMPKPGERVLGGHAVLVVGYDDSTNLLIVRNSWGADWGMKGYFTLPYAYLESEDLSDDFWTLTVDPSVPEPVKA